MRLLRRNPSGTGLCGTSAPFELACSETTKPRSPKPSRSLPQRRHCVRVDLLRVGFWSIRTGQWPSAIPKARRTPVRRDSKLCLLASQRPFPAKRASIRTDAAAPSLTVRSEWPTISSYFPGASVTGLQARSHRKPSPLCLLHREYLPNHRLAP